MIRAPIDAACTAAAMAFATRGWANAATQGPFIPVSPALEAEALKRPLPELARALGAMGRGSVRPRAASLDVLLREARGDVAFMWPCIRGDWFVARRGRLYHVSPLGAHVVPQAERDTLGDEVHPAYCVQPAFALGPVRGPDEPAPSPWVRLWGLMHLERRDLGALAMFSVVLGGLSLGMPLAVQVLVHTIAFGTALQPIVVLAALLGGGLVFAGALQVVQWYAAEVLQRRLFVRVAEDFTRRLSDADQAARRKYDVPSLSARFMEVITLQKAASKLVLDGLALALQMVAGLALLAFYHPVFIGFDAALLIALGGVVLLGNGAVPSAVAESYAKYGVLHWMQAIAARPAVVARTRPRAQVAQHAAHLTAMYIQSRRTHYRRLVRQLAGGVAVEIGAMVALLGLGGWLVMRGELSLGQLVAAELVVGMLAAGIVKLGTHFEAAYDVLASLDKLGGVLDLSQHGEPEPAASGPVSLTLTELVPEGTSHAPLTAVVPAGAKVRVRAPAKAHLAAMAGLASVRGGLDADQHSPDGVVRLSTAALRGCAMWLGREVAMPGTIMDNLRLEQPALDEAGAWVALEAAGVCGDVRALPAGLNTKLAADGFPLSEGAQARLALARAWVAQPPLLVLDGTLDALGVHGTAREAVLQRYLGADAPWTAVVFSEREDVHALLEPIAEGGAA